MECSDMAHMLVMHVVFASQTTTSLNTNILLNAMTSFIVHASLNHALFFAEAGFNYLFLLVWAYLPMVSAIS
jgi:hypothetical protein